MDLQRVASSLRKSKLQPQDFQQDQLPKIYWQLPRVEVFFSKLNLKWCKEVGTPHFVVIVAVPLDIFLGEKEMNLHTLLFVINNGKLERKRVMCFEDSQEVMAKINHIINAYH